MSPISLLRPGRRIVGASAILLPFTSTLEVDWPAFDAHVERTANAGLTPAVNMDTGYVNLIDVSTQDEVLARTQRLLGSTPFIAGAFVGDSPGDRFNEPAYARRFAAIQQHGGMPIVFPSYGLTRQPGPEIVASYQALGRHADRYLGFELTTDLAPFGAVYDLETFAGMMSVSQCVGMKHSSFHRMPEWERLKLRDAQRPEFQIFTGNDFAIDMVMYGSDYLLGLSTFAPDLFALRDTYWEAGDDRFYELNDQLQYLGYFAFRSPGAGYKHNAAMFLKLRDWCACDEPHPRGIRRPTSDREVLRELGQRMGVVD